MAKKIHNTHHHGRVKGRERYADGGGTPSDAATFRERFPQAVWGPITPDKGPSIDDAFSDVNTELPLGRALRGKAQTMRPKAWYEKRGGRVKKGK